MAATAILNAALNTPVNAAFSTATTGGTLAAGTHSYRVSALDGHGGETLASTATTQATTGATSTVTVNWGAVTGATGYKVYGRTASGEQLMATLGNVTTWTDDGSVTPSGALPTVNTTGTTQATSAVITLASGASQTLVVFAASGNVPKDAIYDVVIRASNGADIPVYRMTGGEWVRQIHGPGDYYAKRVTAGRDGTASGMDTN